MVEDKTQDRKLLNQAPTEETPAPQKVSFRNKVGKTFSDMFGIFAKTKAKLPGDPKSPPGNKKTALLKPAVFNPQKINLKTINQALVVFLIGLVILMFYVSLREKPEISSVVAAISKIKLQEFESKKIEPFQEISYYKDEIKKRDIFNVFEEEKPAPVEAAQPIVKAPEPPPVPVVPIEQKAKNIKLVGISWGDNPKVIIRDTSTQNVQFFGVGETIDGTDIKVEKILKNEVILSSEGQEMSLL